MSLRLALVAAAVVAAAGCGGSEESAFRSVPPAQFAVATAEPDRVTINVHVPDEGSIEGTDLSVPFDQVSARADELPDRDTPLAVYCMSGRMSAVALEELRRLGYRDVVELAGGMVAWRDAGRSLLPPAS